MSTINQSLSLHSKILNALFSVVKDSIKLFPHNYTQPFTAKKESSFVKCSVDVFLVF